MITARTVLECETKRLLKRVTNVVRQRIVGFDEDEASDLAVAQLWTIRQLLNPTDSAASAAERPEPPTTPPAGSGQPDLRPPPENPHSGDGADRILPDIGHQLAALIDGYLAEATTDHRQQLVNLLGALRLSVSLCDALAEQLSDAQAELAKWDEAVAIVDARLEDVIQRSATRAPERVTELGVAQRGHFWRLSRATVSPLTYAWRDGQWRWSTDGEEWTSVAGAFGTAWATAGDYWVRVDNPWPAADAQPPN